MKRVAIVGGGVSGLALAHGLLAQGGITAVVLEAAQGAGGKLCTLEADGYTVEAGANGWLDNQPATRSLIAALGLEQAIESSNANARQRYVYRGRELHRVPTGPASFARSRLLSARGKLRLLREPFVPRGTASAESGDETVYAFLARRLGEEAAAAIADVMAAGVFAGDPRELSSGAAFPALCRLEQEHGSLFRGMLARRRGGRHRPRLVSLRGGIATLAASLARSVGAALRTNAAVARIDIERPEGGFRLQLRTGETLAADAVALCCPPAAAAELVAGIDALLARELLAIGAADVAVVALGYRNADLSRPLDGFGVLAGRGEGLKTLGVLWDSAIFANRAPVGHALLRAMLGGAAAPQVLELSDQELEVAARSDLRRVMGITGAPRFVRVFRHRAGIPQYAPGHIARVARIEALAASRGALFVGGNGCRGVSINAAIADAAVLAERISAALLPAAPSR